MRPKGQQRVSGWECAWDRGPGWVLTCSTEEELEHREPKEMEQMKVKR